VVCSDSASGDASEVDGVGLNGFAFEVINHRLDLIFFVAESNSLTLEEDVVLMGRTPYGTIVIKVNDAALVFDLDGIGSEVR